MSYNPTISAAFSRIDTDRTGTLEREEILKFLADACMGQYVNSKTIDAILDCVDADGDGGFNHKELTAVLECEDILTMVPVKKVKSQKVIDRETVVGQRGVTVAQLKAGAQLIGEKLMTKHNNVFNALRDVDEDGSGTLTRDEIKVVLNQFYLIQYVDFYTGQTRGDLTEEVVETLLDLVDSNNDGTISYQEFANIITTDDMYGAVMAARR